MANYADILNVIFYTVIHYAAALYFQLYYTVTASSCVQSLTHFFRYRLRFCFYRTSVDLKPLKILLQNLDILITFTSILKR